MDNVYTTLGKVVAEGLERLGSSSYELRNLIDDFQSLDEEVADEDDFDELVESFEAWLERQGGR